jgi:hypothetical protein
MGVVAGVIIIKLVVRLWSRILSSIFAADRKDIAVGANDFFLYSNLVIPAEPWRISGEAVNGIKRCLNFQQFEYLEEFSN